MTKNLWNAKAGEILTLKKRNITFKAMKCPSCEEFIVVDASECPVCGHSIMRDKQDQCVLDK